MPHTEDSKVFILLTGLIGVIALVFLVCFLVPAIRRNWGLMSSGLLLLIVFSAYFTGNTWLEPWLADGERFSDANDAILIIGFLLWAAVIDFSIKHFLWKGVFSDTSGETIIPKILRDLVTLLVYFVTISIILHFVLGRSISAVVATSGLAALILGYSAQSTLAHVFSGLGTNLAKVFEKGDWIHINGETGKVIDTNWRFLTLETFYGNWLTIPNSTVSSADIKNFSRPLPFRGVILPVLIEGGASPEKVKAILLKATYDADGVLHEPDAAVALSQFQDNGLLYEVWYYTKEPDEWEVNDRILSGIWYALKREGIATSLSDVAIREMPTETEAPKPVSRLSHILERSEIFSLLTKTESESLVKNAERWDVGSPEIILAQGEPSEALFLIETGKFEVAMKDDSGQAIHLASLADDDMFGEISLLTGDPSTAHIRALSEGVIYQITKEMLRPVFENRPTILDELGKLMATRLAHTEDMKNKLSTEVESDELDSVAARLTAQLHSLFGVS